MRSSNPRKELHDSVLSEVNYMNQCEEFRANHGNGIGWQRSDVNTMIYIGDNPEELFDDDVLRQTIARLQKYSKFIRLNRINYLAQQCGLWGGY